MIAVGEGAVWVVNGDDGTLSRIDPRKNQVVTTIPVVAISEDKLVFSMAVGEGAAWITSLRLNMGLGKVIITRLDPKTNEVVATIPDGRGRKSGMPSMVSTLD